MLNEGWVKLHRKIAKWEWWTDPNTAHLFIHLLLSANHEDRRWKGVLVKKGQLITGRNSLSSETGLSPRAVRTCLEHLKSTNEVAIEATKRYSVITICKWDTYQDTRPTNGQSSGQVNAQAPTKHRPSTDQAPTTNKNVRIGEVKNPNPQTLPGLEPNGAASPLVGVMARLSKVFRRRETTKWSPKEVKALRALMPIPEEDIAAIERYYGMTFPAGKNYLRRDLGTLLNNWAGEVDRANNYKPESDATPKPHNPRNDFTCPPVIPYAEIARQRRERAKLRLEQEMAQNANQPPPDPAGT